MTFEQELNAVRSAMLEAIRSAETLEELEQIRVQTLGRQGFITEALRELWKKSK